MMFPATDSSPGALGKSRLGTLHDADPIFKYIGKVWMAWDNNRSIAKVGANCTVWPRCSDLSVPHTWFVLEILDRESFNAGTNERLGSFTVTRWAVPGIGSAINDPVSSACNNADRYIHTFGIAVATPTSGSSSLKLFCC